MNRVVLMVALVALTPVLGMADSLTVTEMAFGTGIENRAVIGVDTAFTLDHGRVYCWTSAAGAGSGDTIFHKWYLDTVLVQSVPLAVRGMRYRTHSYKTLAPEFVGTWTVSVTDRNDNVLAEDRMVVSEGTAAE